MPSYQRNRSSLILAMMIILSLLGGGCTAASPAADPTWAEKAPTSIESEGETPTAIAPAGENLDTLKSESTADSPGFLTPSLLDPLLHEQGFAQTGRQLAYGFEIENPNSVAVSNTFYQILAYNENGVLVGTDEESIPLLLPGQLLGIAGSLGLDDDTLIAQMILQITRGNSLDLAVLPDLAVIGLNYRFSEIYNRVTGLIGNEGALELEDIRISAIAYSRDGRIVGAGYTFLSFLPARTEAGVDIVLTANEPIDRVELYPRVSLPTLLSSRQERAPFTSELDILDQGFSQGGIEVGYGFLVTNPNPFHALEDTEYRITFFNDRREVIAVDQGYIDLLVPQQIFGVGDHVFVDEGETVARMEVLARPSKYTPAISAPVLTAEDVAVVTGTLGMVVSGKIINPFPTTLENLRLSAVIYNEAGRIIGGGYDWIDNLPPDGRVPVEVWVTAPGEPASAELYAGLAEIIRP